MKNPRVLHLVPNLVVGGAQRTVATLRRTPSLDSRVEVTGQYSPSSIAWSDVVVVHAWRRRRGSPEVNVPRWVRKIKDRPILIFNHDWEGHYEGVADLVLVYSPFAAARWTGPQPVTILPGGITVDRFASVARSRDWSAAAAVGRLSTLHPGKISPRTLAYWPQLDAKVFLIGGGGSQLSLLLKTCIDSRFQFLGEIPPSLTHRFLAEVDIFLYDTEWHIESFCYTVLEALAAGCVVVATGRGAICELVKSGENGFLFSNPGEAVRLCNCLLRDSESCRVLSEAGAATARQFTSELMRDSFAAHVTRVLQKSRH